MAITRPPNIENFGATIRAPGKNPQALTLRPLLKSVKTIDQQRFSIEYICRTLQMIMYFTELHIHIRYKSTTDKTHYGTIINNA